MPHQTRHYKPRRKKPRRSQPLGITDPDALRLHRELVLLRIAGAARPGVHRDALIAQRFEKLQESAVEDAPSVTPVPSATTVRRINELPQDQRLDAIKGFLLKFS
jgi:hypothetical protein